jgi:riboflavin kinase/FMN adenylyltransferase
MTIVVEGHEDCQIDGPTAVTVGKFDGVHVGHRELIRVTRDAALGLGGKSIIVTFWPHPLSVLRPDIDLRLVTSLSDRLDLLSGEKPDYIKIITFDRQFAHQHADAFLHNLQVSLGMSAFVIGNEGRIGQDRHAGINEIQSISDDADFQLHVVDPVSQGERVSSLMIRDLLDLRNIEQATSALGRLPSIAGPVVLGAQRGREIGFPTANLTVADDVALLANGVYAGRVLLLGETVPHLHPAVMNLGIRPSFGGGKRVLEAHLLDFSGELYGRQVRIYFEQFVRTECRFSSIDGLKNQILEDIEFAKLACINALPLELYSPWLPQT